MLHDVFFWMVNECIRLTLLVLAMLPIRRVLKKGTARMCYFFWSILPVSILVRLLGSLLQSRSVETGGIQGQGWLFGMPELFLYLLEAVWLIGMTVKLYGVVVSCIRLKRYLVGSFCIGENVYVSSRVTTPFSMGLFAPKIYLPAGLEEAYYPPVILHEKVHIARKDLWVKTLAVFFTVLFWFCPIWNKVCDICIEDMEEACDEAVIRKGSDAFKRQYAEALVMAAVSEDVQELSLGCGREAIEERIGRIMGYGKISATHKRKGFICFLFFGVLFVTMMPLLPNVIGKAETVRTRTGQTRNWNTYSETTEILK